MIQIVNWYLYDEGNIVISNEKVKAYYEFNKIFIYENSSEKNVVDFKNNTYTRKTSEYEMIINFTNKTCSFDFGKEGNCTLDITCKSQFKKDKLILEYEFDESNKKIVVEFNEVIM